MNLAKLVQDDIIEEETTNEEINKEESKVDTADDLTPIINNRDINNIQSVNKIKVVTLPAYVKKYKEDLNTIGAINMTLKTVNKIDNDRDLIFLAKENEDDEARMRCINDADKRKLADISPSYIKFYDTAFEVHHILIHNLNQYIITQFVTKTKSQVFISKNINDTNIVYSFNVANRRSVDIDLDLSYKTDNEIIEILNKPYDQTTYLTYNNFFGSKSVEYKTNLDLIKALNEIKVGSNNVNIIIKINEIICSLFK